MKSRHENLEWIIQCGRRRDKNFTLNFRLKWWQCIRDSNRLNYVLEVFALFCFVFFFSQINSLLALVLKIVYVVFTSLSVAENGLTCRLQIEYLNIIATHFFIARRDFHSGFLSGFPKTKILIFIVNQITKARHGHTLFKNQSKNKGGVGGVGRGCLWCFTCLIGQQNSLSCDQINLLLFESLKMRLKLQYQIKWVPSSKATGKLLCLIMSTFCEWLRNTKLFKVAY